MWRRQSGSYLVWETRMAGLQSGEGRMMIDSVVWAQYTNVTDTQPRRHNKSSVTGQEAVHS